MNRREILKLGAPVAGVAVGLGVCAPAGAFVVAEDPELIRLGVAFEAKARQFEKALVDKQRAVAAYVAPAVPPMLPLSPFDPPSLRGSPLQDVERSLMWNGSRLSPSVPSSHDVLRALEGVDRRTRVGRRLTRKLKLALDYEAAVREARDTAGVNSAYSDLDDAEIWVLRLLKAMFEIPSRTALGLRIKADAMLVAYRADPCAAHLRYGQLLAREVADVFGRGGEA